MPHGPGPPHRRRDRRPVQIAEHRARPRVDAEVLRLLAGILQRQEHRFGRRSAGMVECREQAHRGVGERVGGVGEPRRRHRPELVEVCGHQVDGLVERRRQGYL